MHIVPVITTQGKEKLDHYLIKHRDGRTVEFSGQGYIKIDGDMASNQMREINKYLAWIEQKNPRRIDDIFEGFVKAREAMDNYIAPQQQMEELSRAVGEIYKPVVYEEILALCNTPGWVKLPPDMKTTLGEDDIPEKTYLRNDYVELTALAIYVRLMVPVWAEFLIDAGKTYGTVRKEEVAMSLMYKTRIHDIAAYDRLEDYIRAQTGDKKITLSMTVDYMSTEKVPGWLRSQAIVRRLAVRDLDQAVQPVVKDGVLVSCTHLVTLIFSYVNNLCTERRFSGPIREKTPRGNAQDEDSQGVIDALMVKDKRSPRVLILDIAYLTQMERVLHDVDETAPYGKVEDMYARIAKRYDGYTYAKHDDTVELKPINRGCRALAQWLLDSHLPARSLAPIEAVHQAKALAIAACLLDHWGFPQLAALTVGIQVKRDDVYQIIHQLKPQEIITVNKLYPHAMYEDERTTLPVVGINMVADAFCEWDWDVSAAGPEILEKVPADRKGLMLCPADIRQQLVQLVVRLNEHIVNLRGKK